MVDLFSFWERGLSELITMWGSRLPCVTSYMAGSPILIKIEIEIEDMSKSPIFNVFISDLRGLSNTEGRILLDEDI